MPLSGKRFIQRSLIAIAVVACPVAAGAYIAGKQALAMQGTQPSKENPDQRHYYEVEDAPIPSKQTPFEQPYSAGMA